MVASHVEFSLIVTFLIHPRTNGLARTKSDFFPLGNLMAGIVYFQRYFFPIMMWNIENNIEPLPSSLSTLVLPDKW